jgi:hypothetical protein
MMADHRGATVALRGGSMAPSPNQLDIHEPYSQRLGDLSG